LLGGTIKVESVQGSGTTFMLRIPQLHQKMPAVPNAMASNS
jgi:signal transduction histidine kinase